MHYELSEQLTKEYIPDPGDVADAGLVQRGRTFLRTVGCTTLSPGMLQRVFAGDGQEPKAVDIQAATMVLYTLHEEGMVGPPNPREVGSRAFNTTPLESSVNGITQ